jgi:hypothetical protein
VQGYFINRPKPAPQIAAVLQRFENVLPEHSEPQNVQMSHTRLQTTEQRTLSPFVTE